MRRTVIAILLLACAWPAMASERPAVEVAPSGGQVTLRLQTDMSWTQAIVHPAGPGRWRIVWAASDGQVGGMWEYTLTLDAPPQPDPQPDPTPDPQPDPDQNPYRPSDAYRQAVDPVRRMALSREDATRLAGLYASAATQSRAGAFQSTVDLRAALISSGEPLGLRGKYPGLAVAVDSYLIGTLGVEAAPLDGQRAGDVLETLAWAVWEAGRGATAEEGE